MRLQQGFEIRWAVERVLSGADRSSSAYFFKIRSAKVIFFWLRAGPSYKIDWPNDKNLSVESPFEQSFAKKT